MGLLVAAAPADVEVDGVGVDMCALWGGALSLAGGPAEAPDATFMLCRGSSSALRLIPLESSSGREEEIGVMVLVLASGDLLGAMVRSVSAAS